MCRALGRKHHAQQNSGAPGPVLKRDIGVRVRIAIFSSEEKHFCAWISFGR